MRRCWQACEARPAHPDLHPDLQTALFRAKVARMITVEFAASIQRHKSVGVQHLPAGTLAEALQGACAAREGLRHYILDDQGAVRKHVAVFVNQTMHTSREDLSRVLQSGDKVLVIQCLTGG